MLRRTLPVWALTAGIALSGVVSGPAQARGGGCVAPPVAHRGDSARAPENTLPAYRKALRLGVRRVEADVRFTADGTPVLMHDDTVDRTTDGTGAVEAMTLTEVRTLDAGSWFGPEFVGIKVPTLYEVLAYGRSRGAIFMVELKTRPTPEQMRALLDRFEWLDMADRVEVTSFDEQTVLDVRAAAPGLRTAIIDNPRWRSPSSVLRFGRTYVVNYFSVTRARARKWRRAGIEIRPWTVNDWRAWRRMARDSSGPVVTDDPKRYLAWARAYCR